MNWLKTLFLVLFLATVASATTVTGTFIAPDGTLFTGRVTLAISTSAAVSSAGSCGGPYIVVPSRPVIWQIVNGAVPGGATVVGNDCVTPANSCYVVNEYDSQNNHLQEFRWTITGATVDIGNLTPQGPGCGLTPVGQTITGPITIIGNLTVTGALTGASSGGVSQTDLNNILATASAPGTYLKSDGSRFVPSTGSAAGVGSCDAGFAISANNADAAPTCTPMIAIVAPPATATSPGTTGQIAYDASFFYVCTATNPWRRVATVSG